jgi:hypothetical protein
LDVLSTDAPKHITAPAPDVGLIRRMMLLNEFPGPGAGRNQALFTVAAELFFGYNWLLMAA